MCLHRKSSVLRHLCLCVYVCICMCACVCLFVLFMFICIYIYMCTHRNALVYGAKKWLLYPPQHQVMSNRQISHFFETDALAFQMRTDGRAFTPITCVQTAGDVMLVPESWGHGVLNIQESLAVATEARAAHWRIKPGSRLITFLPGDNQPVGRFPRPQP